MLNRTGILEALTRTLGGGSAAVSELQAVLAGEPDLRIFDEMMQAYGLGYYKVTLDGLFRWLVHSASAVGPEAVLADLERYLAADAVPHRHIMVLGGVVVTEAVQLPDRLRLIPFSALQARHWKADLERDFAGSHEDHRPSAAIEQLADLPKHHVKPEGCNLRWVPPEPYRTLDDLRLLITAIGPSGPVWLGNWTEPDDWVPAVGGAGAAIPRLFQVGEFPHSPARHEWGTLLPDLYRSWSRLAEGHRKHLRVALGRLNAAMRTGELVDASIDLGVALESLLLSDREPDRGELGFTLRLRAARFLEPDPARRRALARLVGALYRARSSAVHTGQLPDRMDGHATQALIAEGRLIAARAAQEIIRSGFPDWQDVVFGR